MRAQSANNGRDGTRSGLESVWDSIIHTTKGDYTNGDWLYALRGTARVQRQLNGDKFGLTVDHQPSSVGP